MIGIYKDRKALGGEISLPKISASSSPRYEILSSILSSYKPGMIQGQKVFKDSSIAGGIKNNESHRRFSHSAIDQEKDVENNPFSVTQYTQTDDEEKGNRIPFNGNRKGKQQQKKGA